MKKESNLWLFKVATWLACYFFAFGLFFTVSQFWEDSIDLRQASSVVVGVLFATVIVATGTISIADTDEDEIKDNLDILDSEMMDNQPKNHLFNVKTFNQWCNIHHPKKLNGHGEDYLGHMQLDKLIQKFYESFDNVTDGYIVKVLHPYRHEEFLKEIKMSWLDGTYKSMLV